ncbi:alpha/beta hydrolase [soil metagenome]
MKNVLNSENNIFVLRDGRKLGYAEYGDPHGKPIFFFHGWPSSRLQAQNLDLIGKNLQIRIISPDRPGYGLSDFKIDRTLLSWPDDIVELADKLNIHKFSIIGLSGGGPYAAVCAYKIPERIIKSGIVVGLSPTNIEGVLQGMAFLNKLVWRNYHRFPILMKISASVAFLEARRYLPQNVSLAYRAKADQAILSSKEVKNTLIRNRSEAFRQGKKGCAMDLKLYTDDWEFDLKKISGEVLLWYGEADKNVSLEMGKYYASQIPNSRLTIYPNEGHMIIRTHTEEILTALMNR